MTTQQLQCFLAVANKLSFTKAAEELCFSVPGVTHHIRQLEAELQTELFIRNRKMVKLTEAGIVFYPYAREMLQQRDMAIKSLGESGKCVRINIGCNSNAELVLLTEVMGAFRRRYPNIEPSVEIDTYDKLLMMLEAGQIDFMTASVHMREDGRFSFMPLVMMKTYAVVSKGHPLAGRSEVSFGELETERLVLPHSKLIPFRSNNPIRDLVNVHRLHNNDFMIEDDRVCLSLAGAGYGIAVLPGYRIPEYYRMLGLSCVPIVENVDFGYGIMYKSLPAEKHIDAFIGEAEKKMKRLWPEA